MVHKLQQQGKLKDIGIDVNEYMNKKMFKELGEILLPYLD